MKNLAAAFFVSLCGISAQAFTFPSVTLKSTVARAELCKMRPTHFFERPLTIAVVDTGLDTSIPFFRDQLWTNTGEQGLDSQGRDKATNGVDDDGNGYVDDLHGWNFAAGDSDLMDPVGHGTHVSGLIVNSGREILAPAPLAASSSVRLMVLKYHDGKNFQTRGQAFQNALEYAVREKADFIHISGGGYQSLPQERRLFRALAKKGIPVVVASGNKSASAANAAFYPSAYAFPNLISVSAIDDNGALLKTTNETPGGSFLREQGAALASLLPGNRVGRLTGTSQAAARLTGKVVELWKQGCLDESLQAVAQEGLRKLQQASR